MIDPSTSHCTLSTSQVETFGAVLPRDMADTAHDRDHLADREDEEEGEAEGHPPQYHRSGPHGYRLRLYEDGSSIDPLAELQAKRITRKVVGKAAVLRGRLRIVYHKCVCFLLF